MTEALSSLETRRRYFASHLISLYFINCLTSVDHQVNALRRWYAFLWQKDCIPDKQRSDAKSYAPNSRSLTKGALFDSIYLAFHAHADGAAFPDSVKRADHVSNAIDVEDILDGAKVRRVSCNLCFVVHAHSLKSFSPTTVEIRRASHLDEQQREIQLEVDSEGTQECCPERGYSHDGRLGEAFSASRRSFR
jgi:hypothetical protein